MQVAAHFKVSNKRVNYVTVVHAGFIDLSNFRFRQALFLSGLTQRPNLD
jgi:hypothetical protein